MAQRLHPFPLGRDRYFHYTGRGVLRHLPQAIREIGRKEGKIGGKRSLETMTPEERTARAKKAAMATAKKRTAARWRGNALREKRAKGQ